MPEQIDFSTEKELAGPGLHLVEHGIRNWPCDRAALVAEAAVDVEPEAGDLGRQGRDEIDGEVPTEGIVIRHPHPNIPDHQTVRGGGGIYLEHLPVRPEDLLSADA